MTENKIYSEDEIMGILNDFHLFQQTFDPNVTEFGNLSDSMTIREWRTKSDLEDVEKVLIDYGRLLNIYSEDLEKLNKLMENENTVTLKELAQGLAKYANFKKGGNTMDEFYTKMSSSVGFKVNSKTSISVILDKNGSKFVELITVNFPGFIKTITETSNKKGNYIIIFGVILIALGIYGVISMDYPLVFGGVLGTGILLLLIKNKLYPSTIQVNGVTTLGELLDGYTIR